MAECGSCKLCCKLLGVAELNKPPGTWCKHCSLHSPTPCQIYDGRPPNCQNFECGWLANDGAPELRPDRIHMIVTGESKDLDAYIIHVDTGYPDAPEKPLGKAFLQMTMMHGKRKNIVLVTGDKRRVIGRNMAVVLRKLEAMDNEGRN